MLETFELLATGNVLYLKTYYLEYSCGSLGREEAMGDIPESFLYAANL